VATVLQLRLHPQLMALRQRLLSEGGPRHQVCLTYVTARGQWYDVSWKGVEERSGGVITNIGIHFFDLLLWLFGSRQSSEVHLRTGKRAAGFLELERADVTWFLSTDVADLPFPPEPGARTTFRSITVDGAEVEFSEGFADLHTRVYEEILAGRIFGIDAARPSIELTSAIRSAPLGVAAPSHPLVKRA
jgi:UDP-N-acetyl-2-amino-2-deoxyglucuronate dehydrogenase